MVVPRVPVLQSVSAPLTKHPRLSSLQTTEIHSRGWKPEAKVPVDVVAGGGASFLTEDASLLCSHMLTGQVDSLRPFQKGNNSILRSELSRLKFPSRRLPTPLNQNTPGTRFQHMTFAGT